MGYLRGGCNDLDRVPAAELISERHHLAVDLGAAAAIADLSVDGVCEIDGRRALHQLLHRALGGKDVDHVRVEVQLDGLHELPVVRDILVGFQELAQPREQDRKSTRLNSSHSQISYAVFCLKKKKKKINENQH